MIFYQFYARWQDDLGRRETWIEAIDRYVAYMKGKVGDALSETEYGEIREALLKQEICPSMRLLWSAGDACDATNVTAYNCLTGDTPVLTEEHGLISLKEAYQYGKLNLLGHDGEWHESVINSFGEQEVVDVTITKGRRKRIISATLDHKWLINGVLKTTKDLVASGKKQVGDKIIPVFAPKQADDTVDYRLGVIHGIIYGDGTTTYRNKKKTGHVIRLCKNSNELIDYFDGYKSSNPASYGGDTVVYLYDRWAKENNLKELPKNVSKSYILGFIRGWFAADGSISNGQASIATTKIGLDWLKRYSGVVGMPTGSFDKYSDETNYGARKQDLFRIRFSDGAFTKDDVLMPSKKEKVKTINTNVRYASWNIHSISNSRTEAVYCATVPETSTFVLDEGIVTGNCAYVAPTSWKDLSEIMYVSMCGAGCGFAVEHENVSKFPVIQKQTGEKIEEIIVDDSRDGWCEAFLLAATAWSEGKDVEINYDFIRPAGARLKTMGGRASGPQPLIDLMNFTRDKMFAAQGRQLTALELHDIICQIGLIVVAGGVRRSALISLSELHDEELRDSKAGAFWENNGQRSMANNSAVYATKPSAGDFLEEWTALVKSGTGERGIFNRGELENQVPARRWESIKDQAQLGVNPCGEIYLRSKQFCNLTSIVVRPEDKMEDLKRKMRLATLLGTYQATLTDFAYLGDEWKNNCEEEQLLGVSITGYFDNELIRNDAVLDELREDGIVANEEYSSRFGSNKSTAITCVKPHGNSGQLLYVGSGMHPWFAKHYIRRVRISVNDPLMKMVQDQGIPVVPEVGYSTSTASTMVMEFPIKAPDGALTNKDVTALDMLEEWKRLKEHFTEHNPSVTIYASDDEWLDIAQFVYSNWDQVGGLSFLPRSEHVYQLAPYEEITEEEYNIRKANFKDIDFSKLSDYEKDDQTTGAKELGCAGPDGCEVK